MSVCCATDVPNHEHADNNHENLLFACVVTIYVPVPIAEACFGALWQGKSPSITLQAFGSDSKSANMRLRQLLTCTDAEPCYVATFVDDIFLQDLPMLVEWLRSTLDRVVETAQVAQTLEICVDVRQVSADNAYFSQQFVVQEYVEGLPLD